MASTNPTPTPNAKRRRLNDAAATLAKPFKSPLRRPAPASTGPNDTISTPPTTTTTTTTTPQTTDPALQSQPQSTPKTSSSQPTQKPTPTPRKLTLPTTTPTTKPPPPTQIPAPDPEYHTLQTTHRTLQSQLTALRNELDTIQQAHRIESSGRDDELGRLIAKWRGVGQKVAEEVLVGTKERVDRMGGVKGLMGRRSGWGGYEGEGKGKGQGDEGEEEEEEFTMDVMLKMMGIDLKVIGYEREGGGRWV
ncbi:hypothetical protein BO94DRAFT_464466 [Aspergillus sclerotioniger CBS 115572]|uniref:Swi5-domain-containing protein n=1 Tax=Aspergillus sclerotioniger CBS 115572 TaxID=1450535 RepID=A0A317WV07_9EURO|nr:hypothetical protein BO94DRAFT_464466 [Aspergillus sclerotioniger CBS 115572]PWY88678.1 hypothetical protein BO94DRAFT_464466 [Aspergillus sclerotioniger CBS 115572]